MEGINIEVAAKIQSLVAEALRVEAEDISAETEFGDLPQWDSMGHMEVMLLLEERYGVEVSAETIGELTSIALISAHVSEYGNG